MRIQCSLTFFSHDLLYVRYFPGFNINVYKHFIDHASRRTIPDSSLKSFPLRIGSKIINMMDAGIIFADDLLTAQEITVKIIYIKNCSGRAKGFMK